MRKQHTLEEKFPFNIRELAHFLLYFFVKNSDPEHIEEEEEE